ncbi:MAG TPA: MFS transporter [Methylomirabilota bacterium]|nr:MFS transporter [Methylomirabilota bacterium]
MSPVGTRAGAARAWLMWALPASLFLIAFFHRAAPGVIAHELMESFGVTSATLGLLSATYFYSYAGFMVPAGLLIDAVGARLVIATGGVVMGAGAVAMGAAGSTPLLFGGRFAVGLGATVTFIGALKIAAAWFPPERFGVIAAVTATVGVIGGLVATTPLAALVARVGWRGAFAVVGAATIVCAALCLAIVRNAPVASPPSGRPSLRGVLHGMRRVLGNLHTWPPFLSFFCLYASVGNLYLWIVPYLRDVYALPTTRAASVSAATSLALIVAAPLTGYVSDAVLRRRKLPYASLCGGLFAAWAVFAATLGAVPLWAVTALLFAIGVGSAGFVLTWPIGREVNPPELAGVAVAVTNLGGFIGAALTQGPVGAVLDARWAGGMAGGARVYPVEAYRAAFGICALLALAGGGLSLLLRETRGRNVWKELAGER